MQIGNDINSWTRAVLLLMIFLSAGALAEVFVAERTGADEISPCREARALVRDAAIRQGVSASVMAVESIRYSGADTITRYSVVMTQAIKPGDIFLAISKVANAAGFTTTAEILSETRALLVVSWAERPCVEVLCILSEPLPPSFFTDMSPPEKTDADALIAKMEETLEVEHALPETPETISEQIELTPPDEQQESVEEIPEPVEEIPEPVEEMPEPVEEIPEPVEEMPEPVEEMPEPVEEMPEPVEEIPEPAEEMPEPVEEIPEPVEEMPEPVEEMPEPVEEIPEPVEETGTEDTKPDVALRPGKIALILDDGGYGGTVTDRVLNLDNRIALAILPDTHFAESTAVEAVAKGFDIMLHIPMQTSNNNVHQFPGELTLEMTKEEIQARTRECIDQFPDAIGVNNHTGAAFTMDEERLGWFLEVVKEHKLFFIDSRTTWKSLAYDVAATMGVPCARREIFLDNSSDPAEIRKYFNELIQRARAQGSAIGIGHFRGNTVTILEEILPTLKTINIELVRISELVR